MSKILLVVSVIIITVVLVLIGLFFYLEYRTGKFQKGPAESQVLSGYPSTVQDCLKSYLSQSAIEDVLSGRRLPGESEKEALSKCNVDQNQIQIYQGKGAAPLPDSSQFVTPFNSMTQDQDACLKKDLSQSAYYDIASGRRLADQNESEVIKNCGITFSNQPQ